MSRFASTARRSRVAGLLVGLVGWGAALAVSACDTPVYRYALYRWQPAPYEVYLFHQGGESPAQQQVRQALTGLAEDAGRPANVVTIAVDLQADPELKRVPPPIREAYLSGSGGGCVVGTPQGMPIHVGEVTEAEAASLVDSPQRRRIAELLAEGKAGVFVLLTATVPEAPDEAEKVRAANTAAERHLTSLADNIRRGKYRLYSTPGPPSGEAEAVEREQPPTEIGLVKVARDDEDERWLVRSLLAVEDDLQNDEFLGEPMVFAVYGRGRALPPYLSAGITEENLLDCVQFITGACSCTVKEQNPGMDLPFQCDWEAVATRVAERFGAEEGNESQLAAADLFPALIIPAGEAESGQEPAAGRVPEPAESPDDEETAVKQVAGRDGDPGVTGETAGAAPEGRGEVATDRPADPDDAPQVAAAGNAQLAPPAGPSPESVSQRLIWTMGGGLILVLVALFVATFLLLRPR